MKNRIYFFLDVMFYYTQLQYNMLLKNVSPSNQPAIILSFFIAFPLALIIDITYIKLFCSPPPTWIFISVCFGCIFLMLKIYEWNERKKEVIRKKPMFFKNKKISIFISIFIEIISLATLFLGGPIGKFFLEQCGWVK
ncbi:MAG: hypothetical protein GW794_14025 [Flavobacteriales bacterium]|nr:hypothetical protein [Flavobacteriales bacterium]NCQ58932.1 hypothetical protein [Flavobacteriales bacterium]NCT16516.1 hypothetical protein [Flavobacteriales bacterium]